MPKIGVGIRIKPEDGEELKGFEFSVPQGVVEVSAAGTKNEFTYDKIFDASTSQAQVFETCGTPMISCVLDGFNGTLFAYGQTGAGKTHTITGSESGNFAERGLCMRCAEYLFSQILEIKDYSISVKFSAVEIYNNTMIDLLCESSESSPKLVIIDTPAGVIVPALHLLPVDSSDDACTLLSEANVNRAVSGHELNRRSSRSHAVYSFHITRAPLLGHTLLAEAEVVEALHSKLNLVDLAGSERIKKTGSTGGLAKEAAHINKSLTYLEQVVLSLSKQSHASSDRGAGASVVSYRQSKLTYLLKDSLGGNCNTFMIACVWPHSSHLWETISTLRFASRMKCIENHPFRNSLVGGGGSGGSGGTLRPLLLKIDALKKELMIRDSVYVAGLHPAKVAQSGGVMGGELTRGQTSRTTQLAYLYASNIEEELSSVQAGSIEIRSLLQMDVVAKVLRGALWEACGNDSSRVRDVLARSSGSKVLLSVHANGPEEVEAKTEGVEAKTEGADGTGNGKEEEAGSKGGGCEEEESDSREGTEALFKQFMEGQGMEMNASHEEIKANLKQAKSRLRYLVGFVNRQKRIIDDISESIAGASGVEGDDAEGIAAVDFEELAQSLQRAKEEYRQARGELKMCKEQVAEMTVLKERSLNTIMVAFKGFSGD